MRVEDFLKGLVTVFIGSFVLMFVTGVVGSILRVSQIDIANITLFASGGLGFTCAITIYRRSRKREKEHQDV